MATEKDKPEGDKPLHNDPENDQALPEAAPDQSFADDAAKPAGEAKAEGAGEAEAARSKPTSKVSERRQEVLERIKAKQAEEATQEGDGFTSPASKGEAEPVAEQSAEAPAASEKPKRKLRVDHRDVEVTDEEFEELARKGLAVGNRLDELNALTRESRAALAEIRQTRDTGDRSASPAPQQESRAADQGPQASQPQGPFDPARIRDVVDKIRVGDGDEGVAEFSSLLEEMAEGLLKQKVGASPEEIAAQVEGNLRSQAALEATTKAFRDQHPEIAADPGLGLLAGLTVHDIVLSELREIGVPEDDLQLVSQNPILAASWHREYQEQGLRVSSAEDIAARATRQVEQKYLRPVQTNGSGQNRTEERVAEKRTDLQNQPRRASAVARQAPQVEKTASQVVGDMRARRGFVQRA